MSDTYQSKFCKSFRFEGISRGGIYFTGKRYVIEETNQYICIKLNLTSDS